MRDVATPTIRQFQHDELLTHHPLVAELVVLAGFRGQGIGRALLRAVVSGERLVEDVECW